MPRACLQLSLLALIVGVGVSAIALGCSSSGDCNSGTVVEPVIAVTNAATGAAICGVTMTVAGVNDGGAPTVVPLATIQADAGCEYEVGLGTGDSVVTVTMAGFASSRVTAVVEMTSCGAQVPTPPVVHVALAPE